MSDLSANALLTVPSSYLVIMVCSIKIKCILTMNFFFKAIVFGSTAKRQRMPSTAAVGVCTWILLKHGTTSTNSSARLEDWSVNYVIDSASKRRSGGHLPLRQCLTTLNTKPMSLLSSSRCCSLVIPTLKKKNRERDSDYRRS